MPPQMTCSRPATQAHGDPLPDEQHGQRHPGAAEREDAAGINGAVGLDDRPTGSLPTRTAATADGGPDGRAPHCRSSSRSAGAGFEAAVMTRGPPMRMRTLCSSAQMWASCPPRSAPILTLWARGRMLSSPGTAITVPNSIASALTGTMTARSGVADGALSRLSSACFAGAAVSCGGTGRNRLGGWPCRAPGAAGRDCRHAPRRRSRPGRRPGPRAGRRCPAAHGAACRASARSFQSWSGTGPRSRRALMPLRRPICSNSTPAGRGLVNRPVKCLPLNVGQHLRRHPVPVRRRCERRAHPAGRDQRTSEDCGNAQLFRRSPSAATPSSAPTDRLGRHRMKRPPPRLPYRRQEAPPSRPSRTAARAADRLKSARTFATILTRLTGRDLPQWISDGRTVGLPGITSSANNLGAPGRSRWPGRLPIENRLVQPDRPSSVHNKRRACAV